MRRILAGVARKLVWPAWQYLELRKLTSLIAKNSARLSEIGIDIVCTHFKEDLSWILAVGPRVNRIFVYDCQEQAVPDVLKTHPKVHWRTKPEGNGHYSYMLYVTECYHQLPDYTMFLHGHDTSWHQSNSISTLLNKMQALMAKQQMPAYCALNDRPYADWYTPGEFIRETVERCWPLLAEELQMPAPPDGVLDIHACQFVAHRSRTLARPLGTWQRIRDKVKDIKHHATEDYFIEGITHILWGEPYRRPCIEKNLRRLVTRKCNELDLRLKGVIAPT